MYKRVLLDAEDDDLLDEHMSQCTGRQPSTHPPTQLSPADDDGQHYASCSRHVYGAFSGHPVPDTTRDDVSRNNALQVTRMIGYFLSAKSPAKQATIKAGLLRSGSGFTRVCSDMMYRYSSTGKICGRPFRVGANSSIAGPHILECHGKSDLYVLGNLCIEPCMIDRGRGDGVSNCCWVPSSIAHLFGCCDKYDCCPKPTHRRAQAPGGHTLPAAAHNGTNPWGHGGDTVIARQVRGGESASNTLALVLACLKNRGRFVPDCVAG